LQIRLIGKKADRKANNIDFSAGNPVFSAFTRLDICPPHGFVQKSTVFTPPEFPLFHLLQTGKFHLNKPWKNRAFY